MPYSAVPDRRMPYDTDGTVVAAWTTSGGVIGYPTGASISNMNGIGYNGPIGFDAGANSVQLLGMILFFPGEQREVTAYYGEGRSLSLITTIQGSNDTTNGVDGTWETATLSPGGGASTSGAIDRWRSNIATISFTGPKKAVRFLYSGNTVDGISMPILHVYGAKAAGQTPDDLTFMDVDDGGGEFTHVEDFGDRPLGTTATRTFAVKNVSATKTASGINIQCNDSDFAISTDGVTWVATINIASLGPGVTSATMYVRNTTPAPGGALGPRFARVTLSGYTFA